MKNPSVRLRDIYSRKWYLLLFEKDSALYVMGLDYGRTAYDHNSAICDQIKQTALQLIPDQCTEKQAVIDINNYICECMEPDEGDLTFAEKKVSPIERGRGDCQVYASMFRDMCQAVGIVCRTVYGTIGEDSQRHVWNLVQVDGKWYYCDCIWNDGGSDEYPFLFSQKLWYGRSEMYPCLGLTKELLDLLE